MHKNSEVSADFWNGCTKTQNFSSQRVLLREQKDICAWKNENGCSMINWDHLCPNCWYFFLKIITSICSTIKFYLFNWRLETLFYFSQHPTKENNIQRFHMFSQWQLMGGRVSKRGCMWSSFQGQLAPFQVSMNMNSCMERLMHCS